MLEVPYANAEQFMMAEKARLFHDDDALDQILRTSAPEEAKALGKKGKSSRTGFPARSTEWS